MLDILGLRDNYLEADLEQAILTEAKERLERRKSFPKIEIQKQIDYFHEPKDDDDR